MADNEAIIKLYYLSPTTATTSRNSRPYKSSKKNAGSKCELRSNCKLSILTLADVCTKAASIFTSGRSPSRWRDIRMKNNDRGKEHSHEHLRKNSDSGQSSIKHVKEVRKQSKASVGSR